MGKTELLDGKVDGTYSYQWEFKGKGVKIRNMTVLRCCTRCFTVFSASIFRTIIALIMGQRDLLKSRVNYRRISRRKEARDLHTDNLTATLQHGDHLMTQQYSINTILSRKKGINEPRCFGSCLKCIDAKAKRTDI